MSLAVRVKRRRQELRMSQSELADLASQRGGRKVSQQSIHELEHGIVVSPRSLPEIASVLQTTIEALIHGDAATAIPVVGQAINFRPLEKPFDLPLYPTRMKHGGDGEMTMTIGSNGKRKTVRTPRMSAGATMQGNTMLPVFRDGDVLLLDSHGPVKPGQDYAFVTAVKGTVETRVAHLVRETNGDWYVQTWTPKRVTRLSKAEWPHAILITGVYRRG